MELETGWVIIYSEDTRSRTFETLEHAMRHLADRRDPEPGIKHIAGPMGQAVSNKQV
jgi:hypothetical protein